MICGGICGRAEFCGDAIRLAAFFAAARMGYNFSAAFLRRVMRMSFANFICAARDSENFSVADDDAARRLVAGEKGNAS